MAIGSGKYDDLCTYVREQAKAQVVAVIILQGEAGSGFSVQGVPGLEAILPSLLRTTADEIEKDYRAVP